MTPSEAEAQPLLIDEDTFLTCGVHIGTKQKSKDMQPYITTVRDDGLRLLDISQTSRQIRVAAEFLNSFEPAKILVVSARQYGWKPARRFAEATGVTCIPGRFTPGRLTNPEMKNFIEPRTILLTDPAADAQPFREALNIAIPVVALCDANNLTSGVNIVIPGNNKGRRALALIYWLLAREMLRLCGDLGMDDDLADSVDDFEAPLV